MYLSCNLGPADIVVETSHIDFIDIRVFKQRFLDNIIPLWVPIGITCKIETGVSQFG